MKLVIRTSSGPFGVGLFSCTGRLIAAGDSGDWPVRSRSVADVFRQALDKSARDTADISEIVVDLGPGGLSSTRAGVSFANAFSFASGTRLSGVCALEMQFHDAARACKLPILSLRPAPGGNVFWAFRDGETTDGMGCGQASEIIDRFAGAYDRVAVAGPLQRLGLNGPNGPNGRHHPNLSFVEIEPPSLRSLLVSGTVSPGSRCGICVLEPIGSVEHLEHALGNQTALPRAHLPPR